MSSFDTSIFEGTVGVAPLAGAGVGPGPGPGAGEGPLPPPVRWSREDSQGELGTEESPLVWETYRHEE